MATVSGTSNDANKAGVVADNSANGAALWASANPNGRAVVGVSQTGVGLWGEVVNGRAVVGAVNADGTGLWGEVQTGRAIVGVCDKTGTGVWGESKSGGTGVVGTSPDGDGVVGSGRRGVVGESTEFQGVFGHSVKNAGVVGVSEQMHGIFAETHSSTSAGIFAHNTAGGNAGLFEGPVVVTGHLTADNVSCPNADYAEQMAAAPGVRAGDCVVLDDEGRITPCVRDYDTRVAGIVSGAGGLRPAVVLDDTQVGAPIALAGKAFVRVDADRGPVRIGDLLTTSATSGHAMRVDDASRVAGSLVGRALTALDAGQGLVKVLVGR